MKLKSMEFGNHTYNITDNPLSPGDWAIDLLSNVPVVVHRVIPQIDRMSILVGENIRVVILSLYRKMEKVNKTVLSVEEEMQAIYDAKVEKIVELNKTFHGGKSIQQLKKEKDEINWDLIKQEMSLQPKPYMRKKPSPRPDLHTSEIPKFIPPPKEVRDPKEPKLGRPFAEPCTCSLNRNKCSDKLLCPKKKWTM